MNKPHSIHFVGIKGVGMAPMSIIAKEAGITVTGSDIADGFITDSILRHAGIFPLVGFSKDHVGNVDLLITTGAHGGFDNEEVQEAKRKGIPVLTQGEAVGECMKGEILGKIGQKGISVAGTHGKTTTTALIASVLVVGGLDPSYLAGTSHISSLGASGHFGSGEYFVAEADEYANEPVYDKTPKLLLQHPFIGVITNIEHDHPDVYPDMASLEKTFTLFARQVSDDGFVIGCGDDERVRTILKQSGRKHILYGFGDDNDVVVSNLVTTDGKIKIDVLWNGEKDTIVVGVVGEHNALNATATYIVGKIVGVTEDAIKQSLEGFGGTKRRMEYIGQLPSGALLYDDYAHHPTEIQATLKAFRQKYPTKHIICIFQPHTYSRTKLLFEEFIYSFDVADAVVFTDIYSSKREAFDTTISSGMLADAVKKRGKDCFLEQTLKDVVKYIRHKNPKDDTVIITMGAGDVYTIAEQILEHGSAPLLS